MDPYAEMDAKLQASAYVARAQIADAKPQSTLSKLIEAVDYLEKATSNVCDIANTIAGSVTIAGNSTADRGYGDGLMAAIEMQADRINALAGCIISDTNRTRSRL